MSVTYIPAALRRLVEERAKYRCEYCLLPTKVSFKQKLSQNFQPFLKNKRVICLDIPDEFDYMETALIELLKKKVLPLLGSY